MMSSLLLALVVVTIATHGFEKDGIAYVMPTDGRRRRLKSSGISLEEVKSVLRGSKASKRL
ncbi:hypothetical protein ACFL4G_04530, partial [Thermodesulfobacteriota bacterium]